MALFQYFFYPALQRSWKWGILVSSCPSVCLSVHLSFCGQNCVCSVSSTILIWHILPTNFRRCVIPKFEFLLNFYLLQSVGPTTWPWPMIPPMMILTYNPPMNMTFICVYLSSSMCILDYFVARLIQLWSCFIITQYMTWYCTVMTKAKESKSDSKLIKDKLHLFCYEYSLEWWHISVIVSQILGN